MSMRNLLSLSPVSIVQTGHHHHGVAPLSRASASSGALLRTNNPSGALFRTNNSKWRRLSE